VQYLGYEGGPIVTVTINDHSNYTYTALFSSGQSLFNVPIGGNNLPIVASMQHVSSHLVVNKKLRAHSAVSNATTYVLKVVNKSGSTKSIFFFTEPPKTDPALGRVYSNSLGTRAIGNNLTATMTYATEYGFWISQGEAVTLGATFSADGGVQATLGDKCDYTFADETNFNALELGTPATGNQPKALTAVLNKFNSVAPFVQSNPCVVGISVNTGNGLTPLASLDVTQVPGSTVSMAPKVSLYAATGSFQAGTVVDWQISNKSLAVNISDAAKFATGKAQLTLQSDGSWVGPVAI